MLEVMEWREEIADEIMTSIREADDWGELLGLCWCLEDVEAMVFVALLLV